MAEKADALVLDLFDHRCALAGIKKNMSIYVAYLSKDASKGR